MRPGVPNASSVAAQVPGQPGATAAEVELVESGDAASGDGSVSGRTGEPTVTAAASHAEPQTAGSGQPGLGGQAGQNGDGAEARQEQASAPVRPASTSATDGVAAMQAGRSEQWLDTARPAEASADPSIAPTAAANGAAAAAGVQGTHGVEHSAESARPLVDQLAHGVHLAGERPGQAVRLVLQPEGLGGVALRIGLTHAGLNVHIAVDNAATRDLVQASWPQLSQTLDQQGMSVDRVFVELAQSQLGQGYLGQGGAGQQSAYQQAPPRPAAPVLAREPAAEPSRGETIERSAHRVDYSV
jgi:flagellar hook-length control protein FliK